MHASSSITPSPDSHASYSPGFSIVAVAIFLGSAAQPYRSIGHPSSGAYDGVLGASKYTFSASSGGAALCNLQQATSIGAPPSSWPAWPKNTPAGQLARYFSVGSLVSVQVVTSSLSGGGLTGTLIGSILPAPINPGGGGSPLKQFKSSGPTHRQQATFSATAATSSYPAAQSYGGSSV